MAYIDEVCRLLRRLDEGGSEAGGAVPPYDFDQVRAAMWEALGTLSDEPNKFDGRVYPSELEQQHEMWASPGYLGRFSDLLARGLAGGIGAQWTEAKRTEVIGQCVREYVGQDLAPNQRLGPLLRLEVGRLLESREDALDSFQLDGLRPWLQGVRALSQGGDITPIGQVLGRLPARDAVCLLLELETALSVGPSDDLRVSKAGLAELREGLIRFDGVKEPLVSEESAERLRALGIVLEGPYGESYTLAPDAIDLVDTVLFPEPNPIRALAESLLEGERGRAASVEGSSVPPLADHAYLRMVVHEVRNATLPLANSLNRLWREMDAEEGPDPGRTADLRERIEGSVARLQSFARDSARLAELTAPTPFVLRDVAEEAEVSSRPDRNGRITADLSGVAEAHIEGQRTRWVLLFVNLMRNSAQARAGRGGVWIRSSWTVTGRLVICVDDDGPGVPEEVRESIFDRGFSRRGASGSGLADARDTVAMTGGTIRCEESPEGGARFRIEIPARRTP